MKTGDDLDQIRDGIIEVISQSLSSYGFSATLGRLFGLLFFTNKPMGLDQMADDLMVSKATVSNNIRILESLKFVQKIWVKGSRKDFYIAEKDFSKLMQEVLKTKVTDLLMIQETIKYALDKYNKVLSEGLSKEIEAQVQRDKEKVYLLHNWLKMSEKWLKFLLEIDLSNDPGELTK